MALRAPEAVLGLVLVGTGPRFWVNPTLFELLASDPPQALAAMARWSLRPNPDPTLLAHNLAQIQTRDPHRVWCELKACALFDQRAALAALSLPVAIIAGAQDRMTPPALTREFLTIWPHASYDTIDRAGHLMMLENPDAFNRVLARLQSRYGW
jgi:pimeloyl-ACP methyl ester carboxylesterase